MTSQTQKKMGKKTKNKKSRRGKGRQFTDLPGSPLSLSISLSSLFTPPLSLSTISLPLSPLSSSSYDKNTKRKEGAALTTYPGRRLDLSPLVLVFYLYKVET